MSDAGCNTISSLRLNLYSSVSSFDPDCQNSDFEKAVAILPLEAK